MRLRWSTEHRPSLPQLVARPNTLSRPWHDRGEALTRLRRGAALLGIVVVLAVCGYRWFHYTWIEAIWMVVITIATVGYGERSQGDPAMMLYTVGVILIGLTAAGYTFGAFMQFAVEGEIENFWGFRKMMRDIGKLTQHVVLCGFGSTGELLAKALLHHRVPFVVVDQDPERIEEAKRQGYLVLQGDATNEEVLMHAGILQASSVVVSLPSDAENVFITLTARNLCSKINIVARAELPSTEKKLRQAGANRVVMPTASSARLMARMVTRPSTAELIEMVSESSFPEMELDELRIPPESPLLGMDVRATEAHRKHRLLVVAVKQSDGKMLFNPDADYRFQAGETILIMGKTDDIRRFREQYTEGTSYHAT